jgi:hypothetical protein
VHIAQVTNPTVSSFTSLLMADAQRKPHEDLMAVTCSIASMPVLEISAKMGTNDRNKYN